jgi:hypothetical protein
MATQKIFYFKPTNKKMRTHKTHFHFLPTHKPNAEKKNERVFSPTLYKYQTAVSQKTKTAL